MAQWGSAVITSHYHPFFKWTRDSDTQTKFILEQSWTVLVILVSTPRSTDTIQTVWKLLPSFSSHSFRCILQLVSSHFLISCVIELLSSHRPLLPHTVKLCKYKWLNESLLATTCWQICITIAAWLLLEDLLPTVSTTSINNKQQYE